VRWRFSDRIAGMTLGVICFKITPIVRRNWPGALDATNDAGTARL